MTRSLWAWNQSRKCHYLNFSTNLYQIGENFSTGNKQTFAELEYDEKYDD